MSRSRSISTSSTSTFSSTSTPYHSHSSSAPTTPTSDIFSSGGDDVAEGEAEAGAGAGDIPRAPRAENEEIEESTTIPSIPLAMLQRWEVPEIAMGNHFEDTGGNDGQYIRQGSYGLPPARVAPTIFEDIEHTTSALRGTLSPQEKEELSTSPELTLLSSSLSPSHPPSPSTSSSPSPSQPLPQVRVRVFNHHHPRPQPQLTILPLELLHGITSFLSLRDFGALTRTHPELYIRLNKTLYAKAPKDVLIRQVKICSDPWINKRWEEKNSGVRVGGKEGLTVGGGAERERREVEVEMGKVYSKVKGKGKEKGKEREKAPTQSQSRLYQPHQPPQPSPPLDPETPNPSGPFYCTRVMTSICASLLSQSRIPIHSHPIPSPSLPLFPHHPIHTLTAISHLLSGPKSLIRQRLDATDSAGYTALHWAARRGDLMMVKYLVGMGARVNRKNRHGHSVLGCALLWEGTEERQGRKGGEGFLTGFLEEVGERERGMVENREKRREVEEGAGRGERRGWWD
ncbi:Similar to PREDICTED: similar to ankyrin 2,3/unc44 [Strongylocentrotus purpuratus]; acc. no. XP_001186448 [Pyronema omphalodes CBS 100304]|uniref:Similar to PREDICTED: similar to ankyrin 2,3/unc44 [Strongylocentrotus purpuratus] acc. no. XP_001186448 n=1 Tax=Pyronema omphalodes (strain CBS 100304) TaxID=1076935 RepID=U4LJA5_PYROM|nr:Similar to PREDICTED: similar to ankyrin 2,3/unc44 [Strongylocentrotus purpuratus]; acc. no. XP_001186448 [Pyronema omphalodes CBS 100304]